MLTADTEAKSTPHRHQLELAVFAEVNAHMRCTEQKHIAVSIAYLGLFGVLLTISETGLSEILTPSDGSLPSHIFLLLFGTVTYFLQRWYRIWKKHYLEIAKNIADRWKMDDALLPSWLRSTSKIKISVDNIFPLAVLLVNILVMLMIVAHINAQFSTYKFLSVILVIGIVGFYALVLWFMESVMSSALHHKK